MDKQEKQITSPIKAIRAKCLDCCCEDRNEVKFCTAEKCPLYSFRFGKNPFMNRKPMTEEQKAKARERMLNMHNLKNNKETTNKNQ